MSGRRTGRRFSLPMVGLGLLAAWPLQLVLLGVLLVLMKAGVAASTGWQVTEFVTLVVGAAGAARLRDPDPRGFCLGLLLGWALAAVVTAGACPTLIGGAQPAGLPAGGPSGAAAPPATAAITGSATLIR